MVIQHTTEVAFGFFGPITDGLAFKFCFALVSVARSGAPRAPKIDSPVFLARLFAAIGKDNVVNPPEPNVM
jgi:hypothetical protein